MPRGCNVCRCQLEEDESIKCQDCRGVLDLLAAVHGTGHDLLLRENPKEHARRVLSHAKRVWRYRDIWDLEPGASNVRQRTRVGR